MGSKLTESRVARKGSLPFWLGLGIVLVLCGVGVAFYLIHEAERAPNTLPGTLHSEAATTDDDGEQVKPIAIPVNTVRPRRKTLERVLVQPGSVRAYAQAELFAKVSGYLKYIRRETTPALVADLVARGSVERAAGFIPAASLAAACQVAQWNAPQADIGSPVKTGDLLIEIAAPELQQDIVEGESIVEQRTAEMEETRTNIDTFDASVRAAKAQEAQADADIDKSQFEQNYRQVQMTRIEKLVKDKTISEDNLDEAQRMFQASQAALKSSQAKLKLAQAEYAVVSSKLATARADLRVKETLVRTARDRLERSRIMASYARLYAPFTGLVTQRGVDEGDFVQNATTGQTQMLMTVTALDKIKVVLQVPEREVVHVAVGGEAAVEVDAIKNWQGKGRVSRVGHVLETQSRTMQVEIDLENPGWKLKPGMYGQVTLTLQKLPDAYALPATAVFSRKGTTFILLVRDGVAERQPVRLLFDDGREVAVAKIAGNQEIPLDGSEEVIVSNKGEIRDGQVVRTTHLNGE